MGTEYQRAVATAETLALLDHARYSPADAAVVLMEPRIFIEGGQLGYDFGWKHSGHRDPELWEMKSNPTLYDVREFVARLPRLVVGGIDAKARFIFGSPTPPVRLLQALFNHVHEATDSVDLTRIVERANNDGEEELVELLGNDPLTAINAAAPPEFIPERQAKQSIVLHCRHEALPGRSGDLRSAVESEVAAAIRTRRSFDLAMLMTRLTDDGILRPANTIDYSELDRRLVEVLAILTTCPLPVPLDAVAAGVDSDADAVESLLEGLVVIGRVLLENGCAWLPERSPLRVVANVDPRVFERTLRHLVTLAEQTPVAMSGQTANALALTAVADHDPRLVAETFAAFDKPSKAHGDLGLIYELARASTAATFEAAKVAARAALRELLILRARNYICGEAWVLQRVGELDRALELMVEARELSDTADDLRNRAFADKCAGRLLRMQAEANLASPHAADLLARSGRLLEAAYPAFIRLSADDPGLLEDAGESLSLLARTLLVGSRLTEATAVCARAHEHLDTLPTSKAYGDLVLLDAEIAAAAFEAADVVLDNEILQDHLARVRTAAEKLSGFAPTEHRPSSEIIARGHMVAGRLLTLLGEIDDAVSEYESAERLYAYLNHHDRADEAAWAAIQLRPEAIPSPLADALARAGADAATSTESRRRYEAYCADQGLDTRYVAQSLGSDPHWWDGLVKGSRQFIVATRSRWSEQQRTA